MKFEKREITYDAYNLNLDVNSGSMFLFVFSAVIRGCSEEKILCEVNLSDGLPASTQLFGEPANSKDHSSWSSIKVNFCCLACVLILLELILHAVKVWNFVQGSGNAGPGILLPCIFMMDMLFQMKKKV